MNKRPILLSLLLLLGTGTIFAASSSSDSSSTSCSSSDSCERIDAELCDTCDCVVSSRTHFFVSPLGQLQSPEYQSLFYDRMTACHEGNEGVFQVVPFGSQSTERGKLATYFTPFCKTPLQVNATVDANETDVLASYFNVFTANGNFESIIRFAPRETAVGALLAFQQRFFERPSGKAMWVGVSSPITYVKNTMGFSEEIINDGGGVLTSPLATAAGVVANMTEAFKQTSWLAGKIDCECERGKTRLADITAVLGFETLNNDGCYMESHFGFSIPTGNRVKTEYLFEPIVGQDKHAGLIMGSSGDIRVWEHDTKDQAMWFHFHAHGVYLIRNTQRRLINLVNKPWSAFMRMYANKAQAQAAVNAGDPYLYTPGVNILTQDVRVHPGFQRTYHTAFTYLRCNFELEGGYNAFVRPAECVDLVCPWKNGPAIISSDIVPGSVDNVQQINNNFGNNNSTGTIADESPAGILNLYNQNTIRLCDLDLQSAAHPCVYTHLVYVAIGHHWDDLECGYPVFAGVGGSYEFLHDNAGLERWNVWAKAGLSW